MSHRSLIRLSKAVLILSLIGFIAVQLRLRSAVPSSLNNGDQQRFYNIVKSPVIEPILPVDESTLSIVKSPSIDEIRKSVDFNNAHSRVYNEDLFGSADDAEFVIVVQVHNRVKYLELLVSSLGAAKGIERTLLIFSHDYHSPEINTIVKNIHFCRVIQIFYPYSIQLFPDTFPGQDPNDCASNIGKSAAAESKCANWKHPDKYGNYRVAKLTQIKHHWWWKMNFIFEGIPAMKAMNNGWVLLLEEDHYVSPDFLHVLRMIVDKKESLCSHCRVITLGFYLKQFGSYGANVNKLSVYPWFSSKHNMGMAINRDTWLMIKNCSQLFCTYDDYNWDWSLMRVNMQCFKERLYVVYAKAPRVFHIGDCGVHNHKCEADSSVNKVKEMLTHVADRLFPSSMHVSEKSKRMLKPPKENGGWGDVRDHQLCINNTLLSKNGHSD